MLPVRSNYSQQVANDTIRYYSWILYGRRLVERLQISFRREARVVFITLLDQQLSFVQISLFVDLSGRFEWIHYSSNTNVEYPHDVASSWGWSNPVNAITTVYRN